MTWTHFYDVASGGDDKEPFIECFIEAPMAEAIAEFERAFLRDQLERHGWSSTETARALEISRQAVNRLRSRYGLDP